MTEPYPTASTEIVPGPTAQTSRFTRFPAFLAIACTLLATASITVAQEQEQQQQVQPRVRIVQEQGQLRVPNVAGTISEDTFSRLIFREQGNAQNARKHVDTMLMLRTEAIDRVCELSDEQRTKLQLAGRGDIKRFFDRVEDARSKFKLVENDRTRHPEVIKDVQPLQISFSAGLFGDNSIFAKTLRRTLSAEQFSRYEKKEQDPIATRYRAKIELAVAVFANGMRLGNEQRVNLVELLESETKPPKQFGPYDHQVVMVQMARVSEEKLKPLFDEEQWRIVRRQLDQVKAMEPQLKRLGVLAD